MAVKVGSLTLRKNASDNQIIATWTFNNTKYPVDNYSIQWQYYVYRTNVWLAGNTDTSTVKSSTFSIPADASYVRCNVKPVRKTKKKNNKTVRPSSDWSGWKKINVISYNIDTLSAPSVDIPSDSLTATITVTCSDILADRVRIGIYRNDTRVSTPTITTKTNNTYKITQTLTAGYRYKFCCRGENSSTGLFGEWSEFTSDMYTRPAQVTGVKVVSKTENTVRLSWTAVTTATSYEVQYTTDPSYFDVSSSVQSGTVETNAILIEGLSGDEYYFRIRAINSNGHGAWSSQTKVTVGEAPAAPTTWALSSVVPIGSQAVLYWTHNSKDGSVATKARIVLSYGSGLSKTYDISYDLEDDEMDKVFTLQFDPLTFLPGYSSGPVSFVVATAGITGVLGDWSIQRNIDFTETPDLTISVEPHEDSGYPITVNLSTTQTYYHTIGFVLRIYPSESYTGVDAQGYDKYYSVGEAVYDKTFYGDLNELEIVLNPSDVILSNGIEYVFEGTIIKENGVHTTSECDLTLDIQVDEIEIDCALAFDENDLTMSIFPVATYAEDEPEEGAEPEEPVIAENVLLSVYRQNYDGTFTVIEEDMENTGSIQCIDLYPSLSIAYYRIVAKDTTTGAIYYDDAEPYIVNSCNVVFQWESERRYSSANDTEDASEAESLFTCNTIKIPYNITVSESHAKDVELIEYIGREHPVSYFGTQQGETASWSVEIPKTDTDTLAKLRQLARYNGNVYVRELTGIGYLAVVEVSIQRDYNSVTIPVSFTITRVEGDE